MGWAGECKLGRYIKKKLHEKHLDFQQKMRRNPQGRNVPGRRQAGGMRRGWAPEMAVSEGQTRNIEPLHTRSA